MIELPHIGIPSFPWQLKDFVGDLLFAEYPTTSIYSDGSDSPIIKEWVDCNDNNTIDRFFYYRTNKINLHRFIEREIPHIELINSSIETYYIFQDVEIDSNNVINTYIISSGMLPNNYVPDEDFFFDANHSLDVDDVINYFRLNEISLEQKEADTVIEYAKKTNSETLYFRIKEGKGVGYGTINTDVLGKTLLNFDKLYRSIALDFAVGLNRGEIYADTAASRAYDKYTLTELYSSKAASYGMLIRPKFSPQLEIEQSSVSEQIANRAFNLISSSVEPDGMKTEYLNHTTYTIKSYVAFLEVVKKLHIDISLKWFSPQTKMYLFDEIDYNKANKIIYNIDNLSIEDTTDFWAKGKFRSLNCDTGHFSFVSENGDNYAGYFDKSIREGSETINFLDTYDVMIVKVTIKEPGDSDDEGKPKYTLMAYSKPKI